MRRADATALRTRSQTLGWDCSGKGERGVRPSVRSRAAEMVILDGEMDDFGRCFADSRDLHERELPEAPPPVRHRTGRDEDDHGRSARHDRSRQRGARRSSLAMPVAIFWAFRSRCSFPPDSGARILAIATPSSATLVSSGRSLTPEPWPSGEICMRLPEGRCGSPDRDRPQSAAHPEGELVLGSVVDITERKRAEELLRARTAALTRSLEECERVQREKMVLLQGGSPLREEQSQARLRRLLTIPGRAGRRRERA